MPQPPDTLIDLDALLAAFRADLAEAADAAALDAVRRQHTGKKSPLKEALRGLRDLAADQRSVVAQRINDAQTQVEQEIEAAAARITEAAERAQLETEWMDLSMPGLAPERGARHPIAIAEERSMSALRRLGFEVVDGPEVDHPFYNFDALNIPEHHPARDAQDTFWVDGGWLLRSHTTTVQARLLETGRKPPFKVATYGRVYRNEAVDATHTAMFHQFEGIWVDRGLTFAHLKATLSFIARSLYGDRKIRFKPKFYPYTEPSAGVDLSCSVCGGTGLAPTGGDACEACHGAGWVTILGSGMIHPKVLMRFGYDPDEVSGIAFGLGTTRMGAQWAGVVKAATLYEQDLRVHQRIYRGGR